MAHITRANGSSVKRCPVNMNREIGSTNVYVWVCKCPLNDFETMEASNAGFARAGVPPKGKDTRGRNEAFLRCAEKSSERLSRLCVTDDTRFESEAERVMRVCSKTSLKPQERKKRGPFTFSTDKCSVRFVPIVSQFQTGGIWLCECEQPFKTNLFSFDVVVGRGNFTTNASPTSPIAEINELGKCTMGARKQLEKVCFKAPGDFDLLALHLLQACCKRIRALSNSKFQCDVWVPRNVDKLKIQREPLKP